jgi:hypothetical protein
LSGVPYTSSYESAETQSAYSPFSYASTSLALDGLSTVVSFGMFERDTTSVTLSPVGIETERNQQNADTGGLGMDAIVGDFTSSLSSVTTEYTSSFSGSLVSCTAVAIKSPLPRGSSIQSDTQWFFDDFNRPNQSITASSDWDENTLYDADNGVNWFIEDGALGGQDSTTLAGFAFLNTASYQWTNDQLVEVVYADIGTFDYGGPAVRLNFGPGHESGSGYVLRHDGVFDDSRRIYRIDNGTLDTTYRNVTYTIVAGDKVRLEAVGNTINCYVNGILEDSLTDSTYESGSVGVFYKKENQIITRLDNFYAQNIVSGQTGKPFKIS